nr:translocon-associated protein subunit delta-like [Leptinotarsa decemlineata]
MAICNAPAVVRHPGGHPSNPGPAPLQWLIYHHYHQFPVGSNQYQVSWTEEPKTARKGERLLGLFNEDGHTTYRKEIPAKEDVSAVPALITVVVNYPGAFIGPWLKSEVITTILSLVIAYFALVSRSKVVS